MHNQATSRLQIKNEIDSVHRAYLGKLLERPLFLTRVAAGFPSPAESYIEGRIDLNRELVRHPLATFYVKTIGDSMMPDICPGELLVVDRAEETKSGDFVIARIGDEMCVKELEVCNETGCVRLHSKNPLYEPIEISGEVDFEIWGKVLYSIKNHQQ